MEQPFFVRNGFPALSFMYGWVYDLFDHRRTRSAYAPLRRGLGVASVPRTQLKVSQIAYGFVLLLA